MKVHHSSELEISVVQRVILIGICCFPREPKCLRQISQPAYYQRAQGCFVWDLDSVNILICPYERGTNILGYFI